MLDRPSLPISEIVQIAANSALARVSWDGGRGRAPLGYIKGMAVMFAVAQRKLAQGDPAAVEMSRAASSDSHRDALAHYASRFAALGMRNDVSGIDTLRHLFVLMIGLGMRELSGRYCEGRDRSASNTSADSAEAGLFQMSWDAHGASRQIPRLLDEYQANGGGGYREIFCEGVTPHRGDLDNCGSGTGLRFQQLCKECPGFAVETAAVGLRNLRTHWGPINRREAELRPEADEMLQQVQRLVASGVTIPDSPPVRDPVPPVHDATWLQRSLNALGADPRLAEDGVYGRLTVAAVQQFQQQNGLSASGVADAATIAAIESKLRPTVPGPIPSGPTDLIALLERLVMLIEKLQGHAADDGPIVRPVADRSAAQDARLASGDLVPRRGRQDAAARPGQRRARADDRQSARRQEDRDRPAWRSGHAAADQSVRDRHARPAARRADAGHRPERLRPAGLPRPHRLGRARQDGEMVARNSAAAADIAQTKGRPRPSWQNERAFTPVLTKQKGVHARLERR